MWFSCILASIWQAHLITPRRHTLLLAMSVTSLEHTLNDQITRLLNDVNSTPPELMKIRTQKLVTNVDFLRTHGISPDALLDFENRLIEVEFLVEKQSKAKAAPAEKAVSEPEMLDELNSLPSTFPSELRNRKKTKMEVNQDMHNELSEDLVAMVQKIRANAEKFNEKLEADKSVVDAAADALQNAGSNMSNVGQRLSKYRKSSALGWKFYIMAVLGIIGSLMLGMMLIHLFPKF